MTKIINFINYILIGATIIFFLILIFVVILSVLAEEPIPTIFIRSTLWVAIIWLIFEVLKRLFVKKKDNSGPINDQNKDK